MSGDDDMQPVEEELLEEPAGETRAEDMPAADEAPMENPVEESPSGETSPGEHPPFANPDLDLLDAIAEIDPTLFERKAEEPPFGRQVLTTALHLAAAAESRTNLWTQWNGFTTPDILTDIEDEYRALRHAAALSDISPLVKYRISGRDAAVYLNRLVADNVLALSVDEAMPVAFCEDHGLVVGDGLLFRLDENEYRLATEETHLAWLQDSAFGFQVRVEDLGTTLAALSVQGPLSASVLAAAGLRDIETLRPYAARWFDIAGMPVYASRTGMSGDLGYELWMDPEDAPMIWVRLLDKGAPFGLAVTGFALRELARVEAGIPRAGRDYLGAFSAVDPADASTPFELGLASIVDLEAGHFTGRDALQRARARPPRHFVVSLALDFPEPLDFRAIQCNGAVEGLATSTGFSRELGVNLAIARLKAPAVAPGAVLTVDVERREGFSLRRQIVPARVLTEPALTMPSRHVVPAPLLSIG